MTPLLSVVVPAYGVGEYLPACLDSILASTLTDLEVIVVDDGSPDECGEIADDYARFDDRVKVLHTENQGLGEARNTGTEAASGKYLVFADSDDLIPPRAYELLVGSLEQTGSDIAAGNTWRYVEGKGNVQSWTHKEAFETTRLKTHIREFPLLIRDRMVWNKVFRRSFWDREGFTFPPIRYEDYPVTLPAHLKASSVDVHSDKVYLWRERLAENSITQRSLEPGNLRDRVTSATMTLDIADEEGGEIRDRLHAYFTDVDIITLATGLFEGEEEHRGLVEELSVELADRLDPKVEGTTALAHLVHKALLSRDFDRAAALARWRRERNKAELMRAYAKPAGIRHLPGLVGGLAFQGKSLPQLKERKLKSRIMEVTRSDQEGHWQLTVETRLRRLLLERATISASFRLGDEEIPLESSVSAFNGQRVTVEVLVTDELVARLDEPAELRMHVAVGAMTWAGSVAVGRGDFPEPIRLGDDIVVMSHSRPDSWDLWVRRAPGDSFADLAFEDDNLVVRVEGAHECVAIVRPAPSAPLIQPVEDGIATFPLAEVLDDPADDPVTSRAYRDIIALSRDEAARLIDGGAAILKLIAEVTGAGGDADAGAPQEEVPDVEKAQPSVVPSGVEEQDPDAEAAEEPSMEQADAALQRTGITVLVLREGRGEVQEWGEHQLRVNASRRGTAELSHQRLDHLRR